MRMFFRRIWRYFFPHYVLQVTHRRTKKVIYVKKFHKKTAKRITGVTTQNTEFEIVSVDPMDYYIEEYRADLYQ
jgi:hypothetical protein